jgi:RNA polymerase sigma-70 factor, ECF subfamily
VAFVAYLRFFSQQLLHLALQEVLDAPHREVIELANFGGLSQREISKRNGMPLGTVKSRTKSAFQRLRRELALEDTLQEAIR